MELILMIVVIILVLGGFALLLWRTGRRSADFSLLMGRIDNLRDFQERTDRSVREEIARSRAEARTQAQQERTEITGSFKLFEDSIQNSLSDLTAATEKKIEAVRLIIDTKLREIQEDNSRQLDRMRETVDEKLQTTLEKRLGESFRQVSERLEMVHQGLGQMRELAADVGNLQKVLTNVKARGTWGEVQLGALLEEMLSPEQYLKNVRISESGGDFVEFAIKLPES